MTGQAPNLIQGELGLALLIGLGVVVALTVFLTGYWIGRARRTRGLPEIERALQALARGETDVIARVHAGDPAARAAGLIADVAHRVRERQGRPERRANALIEGLDGALERGVLVLDRELVVVAASEGAARLLGSHGTELDGRALQDVVAPESFREVAALAAERRRHRTPFRVELVLRSGGAPAVLLTGEAAWLPPPTDGLAILLEHSADLQSGEAPPKIALESRQAILDGLADGVLVVREGRILEVNPEAAAWLGADVAGAALKDLIAAEDLLLVLERVGRAEDGEQVQPLVCRLLPSTPGLASLDVELFAAPVRFGGRRAAALTLRDLGPERRAERRARVQEARLLSVLDAVGEGLALLTPPPFEGAPWRVGLINRRMLQLLGLDSAQVLGAPEDEFRALAAHRFQAPGGFAGLLTAAARTPHAEHQGAFDLADEAGALELFLSPVVGREGELLGRLVLARDVTRRRETEKQLVADAAALARSRESLQRAYEQLTLVNRDLERKTTELDRLNRELVELDRARAQLLADASHELHTPLVSIRGYTQMIIEGRLGRINDEQRRGLEVALRNVDRMVELINNLLGLARAEGKAPLQPAPVDPGEVAAEVVERHQQSAQRKGVQLEVQIEEPGLRLTAEREGLVQVLDNLVSNGIKFNRNGGRVLVTVQPAQSGFAKLEVSDTGIGVPPEEQGRIFERFYRGRSAAGTSGSGIGLATVRNIVVRHGGAIEMESAPGQGSTFRILWPRAEARPAQSAPPSAAASN